MNAHTAPDPLAGFDLGPVIDWLTANRAAVSKNLHWLDTDIKVRYEAIEGAEHLHLSSHEISNALMRFPQSARDRSVLTKIIGMPFTWFAKGTTFAKPETTQVAEEALSPRAIVPGYSAPNTWTTDLQEQWIRLYHLGQTPPDIARYMQVHALIHEYVHTIINPMWYSLGRLYMIKMPGLVPMDARMFFAKFVLAASKYPAISHYAAAYRPLPTSTGDPKFIERVGEELCESVVAFILGHIYCDDPKRCLDPFMDRPDVRQLVTDFLQAKHIPE
ncbi:MAG: hypothetical protein AAB365_01945 [Patescibacteria group bacterium]